jgi:F-type H+-transporting ATPase subunit delta
MMKSSAVAARYAKAFVNALQEQNKLDDHKVFLQFCDLVAKQPELDAFLSNVVISPKDKVKVLTEVSKHLKLPTLVTNFLRVLADKRRIHLLPSMKEAVRLRVDEILNIKEVHLTCAAEPSVAEIKAFEESMAKVLGCQVRVKTATDRNIIGGAVARVGSYVFDGSVSGQLGRLRTALVKEN